MKVNCGRYLVVFMLLILSGCSFEPGMEREECESGYVRNEYDECVAEEYINNEITECTFGYTLVLGTCVKDNPSAESIVVYFERPSDWPDAYVYYYDTDVGNPITWDDSIKMRALYGHIGWYYSELPEGLTYARIIFKSSEDDQIPGQLLTGQMIDRTTWFYMNYDFTTNNPFEED